MPVDLLNPGRAIEIGVILVNSETEVLDIAPVDLLNGIGAEFIKTLPVPDEIKAKAPTFNIRWITEKGDPAKLTANMTLSATDSFDSCPPLDIVLMGAHLVMTGYKPSEAELAFIRKAHDDCVAFLTICGGFMAPQMAGILAGKTVTAPRFMVSELQKQDPRSTWVEKRAVHDGKIWTSGTLLNGLDLMREFMLEYWPEITKATIIPISGIPMRPLEYEGADGLPVVEGMTITV